MIFALGSIEFAAHVKRGKLNATFKTGGKLMTTITFDTHEFFNELKGASFSDQQAETITKLQKAAVASTLEQARMEYDLDNLVNQSMDNRLREMELRLDARFVQVDARFIQMEQRLIIKLGALMAFSIGIVTALVKLL